MNTFSLAWLYAKEIFQNISRPEKLVLISEPCNWSINEDCKNIQTTLQKQKLTASRITITPLGLKKKVLHFASENTLVGPLGIKNKGLHFIHPSNKIVFTWFHISPEDEYRLQYIPLLNQAADLVHTASQNTKKKLVANGLQEEKIVVIPLGINLELFHPLAKEEKKQLRLKLGLPLDKIIIGSFQKDGVGWNDGLQPKLIKGPDIFCDVVEKLAQEHPLHVMLTGPARGYVKNRLNQAGIPYSHVYLENYLDIIPYFQVLDLYLVTSREEGGPKAVLESLACGVPLVSTKVGMALDMLTDGHNGLLANIEDTAALTSQAQKIIQDPQLCQLLIENGLQTIQDYDLKKIIQKMHDQLYLKLMAKSSS